MSNDLELPTDDAMHKEWFLIVLLSAAGCRNAEAKGSKQLTLAVFMNGVFTNQSEIAGGQIFLTGLDLTLELLNNDSRLLPGYFLNYTSIVDTRVSGCTDLCKYHPTIGPLSEFSSNCRMQKLYNEKTARMLCPSMLWIAITAYESTQNIVHLSSKVPFTH